MKFFYMFFLLLFCLIFNLIILDYLIFYNTIYPGIYIGSYDFSYLSQRDGTTTFQLINDKMSNIKIIIESGSINKEYNYSLTLPPMEFWNYLYAIGRKKSIFENYVERRSILNNHLFILPFDQEYIKKIANDIWNDLKSMEREPIDAKFKIINSDKVVIIPETDGLIVNYDMIWETLNYNLNRLNNIVIVNHPFLHIPAAINSEILNSYKIERKIYSYSTKFDESNISRSSNIKISADILNYHIIFPDQVVSFNEIIGPRTAQRGFLPAPIFIGDKIVDDTGGGICQLSSTIYNLALLADFKILERSNHSRPVSYVPLGLDATVAYDYLDFKFKNTNEQTYLLYITVNNGVLTANLFGHRPNDYRIKIETEIVEKIPFKTEYIKDTSLESGQQKVINEGSEGYIVKSWRVKEKDGTLLARELISTSEYKPINKKVIFNN